MHATASYRGNRPTNKCTNPQTGPITIHCAAASAQCNNSNSNNTQDDIYSADIMTTKSL